LKCKISINTIAINNDYITNKSKVGSDSDEVDEFSDSNSDNGNSNIRKPEHQEILKNIHSEMKDNNSNLYRERIMILKKIKETPDIHQEMKNKICGRLLLIFKSQIFTKNCSYDSFTGFKPFRIFTLYEFHP
jgi:prophage tail gpP-like protein